MASATRKAAPRGQGTLRLIPGHLGVPADVLEYLRERPEAVEAIRQQMRAEGDRVCGPADLYALVAPFLQGRDTEHLVVVALDARGRPVATETIGIGSDGFTIVCSRTILRWALAQPGVQSIALAHNHPSGDPSPSSQDRNVTRLVHQAGRQVGIRLVEHLIVGGVRWTSLAEEGVIPMEYPERVRPGSRGR